MTEYKKLENRIKELEDRITRLENTPAQYVPPPVYGPIKNDPFFNPPWEPTCQNDLPNEALRELERYWKKK